MKSNGGFDKTTYQNNYIRENYDRVGLTVPKGRKEEIRKKASAEGKSINKYINRLIEKDMQRT